ncbi:hypothetical protein TWF694_001275 [Orbilia ellipsospora]|uniref:Uncharacterized protein n=1 Tax=Orbilia ellipsospora TaxID=2528407 RepID=A0AAV9XSR3_9PEZI
MGANSSVTSLQSPPDFESSTNPPRRLGIRTHLARSLISRLASTLPVLLMHENRELGALAWPKRRLSFQKAGTICIHMTSFEPLGSLLPQKQLVPNLSESPEET